jgi:HK97 gp10 family phage protein
METIQGMSDLLKTLDDIESLVSRRRILSKALKEGSRLIQEEAEHLAPRSDEAPHMADTMMVAIQEATSDEAISRIGPSKQGFYGLFQEIGTAHHHAQPFLQPAFDAKIQEATAVIGYFLKRQIESQVKRQNR